MFFIINVINFFFLFSISLSLLLLLSSVYVFSFIYLFFCLHAIIRIITIVTISIHFLRLFIPLSFLLQSAKQPVSKTPPTYFRKAEDIGITTRMSVTSREVTQSPSKLKKNGTLSIMRFKSVVLGILVRGTLVQGRETRVGLGRVENN